jgi:cell division protein FtsI (penicillin-binding protein 3)
VIARGDRRLRLILGLSVAAFLVVVLRAVQVQAVDGSALAARAVQQQQNLLTVPGLRGTIFSADGQPLAQEQPAVDIAANQRVVRDKVGTARVIALALGYRFPAVPHPKHSKKHRLSKGARRFIRHRKARRRAFLLEIDRLVRALTGDHVFTYIVRQADPEVARAILAHHPPGLIGIPTYRRAYPNGSLAAQLLGFTDIDSSGRNGGGLEQLLDPYLHGAAGEQLIVHDAARTALETVPLVAPRNGRSVRLTIDSTVEAEVQNVLARTVRSARAHAATAIVMNPRSGAIIAMASAPGYDNNHVHDLPGLGRTTNLATDMAYEPGSVFKAVTYSAALSEGLIYPDETFANLPYQIQVADKKIHDDAPRPPVTLTARQCLAQSSNVCAVKIAGWVRAGGLLDWIHRYGFGHYPGLRFPGDTPGLVPSLDHWSGSSIGTIPIGQGISVTPLQIANMYAAIANGGVMPPTHLIESIQGVPVPRHRPRRILRPDVDRELVSMLKGVVDFQSGTGVRAQIPGYSVAGKTGTAQKADGHGGYARGQYMASFVGFLPASNPQVVITVVVDTPHTSIFGGTVAAPAFEEIGAWYARYAGLEPDRAGTPQAGN